MSASLIFRRGGRALDCVIGVWLKKRAGLGSLNTARCSRSIASLVWVVAVLRLFDRGGRLIR